jgi:hypothetical protein
LPLRSQGAEDIVRAERTVASASIGSHLSGHTLDALVDLREVIVGEKAVLAELEKHRSGLPS